MNNSKNDSDSWSLVDVSNFDNPVTLNFDLSESDGMPMYTMEETYDMVKRIIIKPYHLKYALYLNGSKVIDIVDVMSELKVKHECDVVTDDLNLL